MSAIAEPAIANPDRKNGSNEALGQGQPARSAAHKNYKGFVAGVFSGISKLTGKSINRKWYNLTNTLSVGHPYALSVPKLSWMLLT